MTQITITELMPGDIVILLDPGMVPTGLRELHGELVGSPAKVLSFTPGVGNWGGSITHEFLNDNIDEERREYLSQFLWPARFTKRILSLP